MANSQNGWPVVGSSSIVDKRVLGVEFPNGWLEGDVDVIFTDLIFHLDKIESIVKGGCWGYFVKKIEGSGSISNHASGTAIDYNAPKHAMGTRNTYSASERTAIRSLLKRYDGVIRWGGDYTGRPDDMHFEINASKAAVKQVADAIRNEGKEEEIMAEVADFIASVVRAIDPEVEDNATDRNNRRSLEKIAVYLKSYLGTDTTTKKDVK